MTSLQLANDLLTTAIGLRVVGGDAAALLRRVAAAGVRVGVHELSRTGRIEGGQK